VRDGDELRKKLVTLSQLQPAIRMPPASAGGGQPKNNPQPASAGFTREGFSRLAPKRLQPLLE
jgi:hypothetical protein